MKSLIPHKLLTQSNILQIIIFILVFLGIFILGVIYGKSIDRDEAQIANEIPFCVEIGIVKNVIDGDTITLTDNRSIRYLGINTPETSHPTKGMECYGDEATKRNRELVQDKSVTLLCGKENIDEFGRYLRYIFVDNTFVNAELVTEGYAVAFPYKTEEFFDQFFIQLEEASRSKNKGIWAECQ